MEINKKRFRDFDSYMKLKFNKKIIKLPLDGGFTCPNRDGSLSSDGCIFCSESGSGEWTYGKKSLHDQIVYQKARLSKAGRDEAYLAYFQNFTNTYGPIDKLRKIYYGVLEEENIIGLAIATRADCLNDEVLDLLEELSKKTFLIVELGMQSVNDRTLKLINRGYDHGDFDSGIRKLHTRGIKTLVHLIIGLPYENLDDYKKAINYINEIRPWGIKIHNLYIEKDTRLEKFYRDNDLSYDMTEDFYVDTIVEILTHLDKDIVINRLTGDGLRDAIAYPSRAKNKGKILTKIDKMLKEKDLRQGDLWKEN